MAQLSYSFCMSLLHSLWQAGILVLLYWLAEKSLQQHFAPLQKKNLLFISVSIQIILCISTFFIYYFKVENDIGANLISEAVNGILSAYLFYTITPWLFVSYLFIFAYKVSRTVYDWYVFKATCKAGMQKPGIDLKLFTVLQADHFGIKRKVQLWFSNTIHTPLTFGFFKPVIILPVALVNRLSIQQAEALILHELTHIRANDYLLNWLLLLTENIFFFNPFILTLCKKIKLEREKYCDINVMAFNYAPLVYAETLLQAQLVKQNPARFNIAAVGKQQELLHRIRFFTNTKNQAGLQKNGLTFPLLSSLLLLFFVVIFYFQYSITKTKVPVAETITIPVKATVVETGTTTFVNSIVESLTDEKLKGMQAAVEKQQPVIENQLKKTEPLIRNIENMVSLMAEENSNNDIIPASIRENDATRQIIVKEEQSGSKNATVKVYTLSFVNGRWVLQPEWKLSAKEISAADTLNKLIDTTSIFKNLQTAF